MKSISTDTSRTAHRASHPRSGSLRHARRRRGNAEIELLLVIPILLLILFVARAALQTGDGRLDNAFNAENSAYTQVESAGVAMVAPDAPPAGINAIHPDPALPNYFSYGNISTPVTTNLGNGATTATYRDQAVFLDPSWHFSQSPHPQDQPTLQDWFTNYADEMHPGDMQRDIMVLGLGLQPPGPP